MEKFIKCLVLLAVICCTFGNTESGAFIAAISVILFAFYQIFKCMFEAIGAIN